MLKANSDGYTFDRGNHKRAVQFFGTDRENYAKQFNAIMSGRDTYKALRATQLSFTRENQINRGFPGSRPIFTVVVTYNGEKVAEFHSQNRTDVTLESRAFIRGAKDDSIETEPVFAHHADRVRAGLQRKVEEQRKEITKLKSGFENLLRTHHETLRRLERDNSVSSVGDPRLHALAVRITRLEAKCRNL